MEVTEDPSALEVVVAENPVLKGSAGSHPVLEGVSGSDSALVGNASYNPAPEGVQVSSPSYTSMDVHVGSSPPRSDGVMAMHASLASSK
jgi:hypothetical protein